MMRKAAITLASIAALGAALLSVPGSAEAHRHHAGYALYYDYTQGNTLSPASYVYPAANWGPFFHRVRHYGPVLPYQPPVW
jgi:hypothetical protein